MHELEEANSRALAALGSLHDANPDAQVRFEQAVRDGAIAQMSIDMLTSYWGPYVSAPRQPDNESEVTGQTDARSASEDPSTERSGTEP